MRIELASGTTAEIVRVPEPTMGLVIIPDLFGLRPLFDDLVARLAHDWNMSVCAIDHFVGQNLGSDPDKRLAALPLLDDANYLRDVHEAADELGTKVTALMGFCMGGMYCLKSAGSQRFDRIVCLEMQKRYWQLWVRKIRIRRCLMLMSCDQLVLLCKFMLMQNMGLHTMRHVHPTGLKMQQMRFLGRETG